MLHCASFFGIIELVVALIEVGASDINGEGCWGSTPLSWAAYNGNEEVVEILLGREEVNPDKADKWGNTPLSDAACNGHEGVVKIVLEWDEVNPDRAVKWNQTPLPLASLRGHEGVVKILFEREEVNPDRPDRWGKHRSSMPPRIDMRGY